MSRENLKVALIGLFALWVLLFSMDMMFGITWPTYTMERIFIWIPTVLLGVYWLIFGGDKREKKGK